MYTVKKCPKGHYCPAGTKKQYPCPAGTYSPFENIASKAECTDCDPGKYCTGGKDVPDGDCNAGFVCPKKSPVAISSSVYSKSANTPGLCPAGYYCEVGTAFPKPCPIGTYRSSTGGVDINACISCPAGRYCDELAMISPGKPCAAGHLCTGGATHARPLDPATEGGKLCSKGRYCPAGTTMEMECLPGTFENREGSSQCQTCPAGYYCTSGLDEPMPCDEGNYCPKGSTGGLTCPDGTFGRTGRNKLENPDQCTPCIAGRYCNGGKDAGPCIAGYYCDVGASKPNQISRLCPTGHYCLQGAELPTRCDPGKFNMDVGAKDSSYCKDCTPGYYCIAGSSIPIECPYGHYCVVPSSKPDLCPKNTLHPDSLRPG